MEVIALTKELAVSKANELLALENNWVEIGDSPWDINKLMFELPLKWELSHLAIHEGKIVGYQIGSLKEGNAFLNKIIVNKDKRGLGIGKNLLKDFLDKCINNNIERIIFRVRTDNPAVQFYDKLKFSRKEGIEYGRGDGLPSYFYDTRIRDVLATLKNPEMQKFLEIGKEAAKKAGEHIIKLRKEGLDFSKKSDGSLVSNADIESEKLVIDYISKYYPNHNFVGEELGFKNNESNSDYLWTIDPIDGTSAYLNHENNFCVNIALLKGKETIIGTVYNPVTNEMFSSNGFISEMNNGALPLKKYRADNKPVLNFQAPKGKLNDINILLSLREEGEVKKVVEGGSPAYNLAQVAKGTHNHFIMYCDREAKMEDYAGPFLIVKGAGGVITDLEGKDIDPLMHKGYMVASSNSEGHKKLLNLLKENKFGEDQENGKVIFMGGFYGTGKSTLSIKLEKALGYKRFNSDITRRELEFQNYDIKDGDVIWGTLFWKAAKELDENKGVIIESTYLNEEQRKPDYDLAKSKNAEAIFMEVICPEKVAKERIASRPTSPDGIHVPTNRVEYYDKKKDLWKSVIDGLSRVDRKFISYLIYDSHEGKLYYGLLRDKHKKWAEEIAKSLGVELIPATHDIINSDKRYAISSKKISPSKPFISDDEINSVASVVKSGKHATGKVTELFENKIKEYIGVKYAKATTSGTTALHLGLKALGIIEGDEVIIPSYVCNNVLHAINYCGAKAVLVDIDSNYFDYGFNISAGMIRPSITKNTKAVIVPHLFGIPADMDEILKLGIPVIEDCCQSIGASYKGKKIGSMGIIGIYSFYATKVISTGHGGMIVTSDEKIKNNIDRLTRENHDEPYNIAFNYGLTDIQSALGIYQLDKLNIFMEKRKELAKKYNEAFENGKFKIFQYKEGAFPFRYLIKFNSPREKEDFRNALKDRGISIYPTVYRPLHRYLGLDAENFKNTEDAHETTMYIPLYPALTDEDVNYIIENVVNIIQ
ncbi:MAG: inositol monophosphatase family protein [Nanoarchaeota archaeon]|nr:inositol monophosphatase family protein [Nanoarchaeota archaeon]